jgi:hypothetical protein
MRNDDCSEHSGCAVAAFVILKVIAPSYPEVSEMSGSSTANKTKAYH